MGKIWLMHLKINIIPLNSRTFGISEMDITLPELDTINHTVTSLIFTFLCIISEVGIVTAQYIFVTDYSTAENPEHYLLLHYNSGKGKTRYRVTLLLQYMNV